MNTEKNRNNLASFVTAKYEWIGSGQAFQNLVVERNGDNGFLVYGMNPVAYGNLLETVSTDSLDTAIEYVIGRDREIFESHEFG